MKQLKIDYAKCDKRSFSYELAKAKDSQHKISKIDALIAVACYSFVTYIYTNFLGLF